MTKARWSKALIPLLLAMAAALFVTGGTYAASSEYQVKAAFIYNFTQFIEWPKAAFSSPDAPFVIGVVGDDPFDGALERMTASKSVGNRHIVTAHFNSVADLGPCQVVFLPSSADSFAHALVEKVGKSPVLIVGESESVLDAGGAARLYLEEGRMRFQMNPEVLESAKLRASAKLLQLARIYKK